MKCRVCEIDKDVLEFYKGRSECRACQNKARRERETKQGFFVYYLPNEHYCGFSNRLKTRINRHKVEGRDVDGWKVLYHSFDKADAAYHEALFQSTLGINGLNFK